MENTIVTTEQTPNIQNQVNTLIESRAYFIEKVLPILKENQDYFTILNKKSLAKGGAEKLASIFNFVASFSVDKDTMDLLKVEGLVAYICDLKDREGNPRGQGRGADTLVKNKQDANRTIKMAQKRAFVDAVIRATGLSDIFTQDLEDTGEQTKKSPISISPKKVIATPESPKTQELVCHNCAAVINSMEHSYSLKMFKKSLCRVCQQLARKEKTLA